jgi:Putative peptidoglycan binding domain
MNDMSFTIPARVRSTASRSAPAQRSASQPANGRVQAYLQLKLQRMLRRPMRTLFHGGMLIAGVMIGINALMLQTSRHPAPWGASGHAGASGQNGPMSGPALSLASPLPPSRPVDLSATPQPALNMAPTVARTASREPVRESSEHPARSNYAATGLPAAPVPPALVKSAAKDAPRDAIADLLRAGDPAAAEAPARPLATAQRALMKLGYGLPKADGVNGAATRTAIEKFEKDRHLPVTGELNARTRRELASASGLKLD